MQFSLVKLNKVVKTMYLRKTKIVEPEDIDKYIHYDT